MQCVCQIVILWLVILSRRTICFFIFSVANYDHFMTILVISGTRRTFKCSSTFAGQRMGKFLFGNFSRLVHTIVGLIAISELDILRENRTKTVSQNNPQITVAQR